jgi:hypothetical protein
MNKKPGPLLKNLIELADLVPPEYEFPEDFPASDGITTETLLESISILPDKLNRHLLQVFSRPEKWPQHGETIRRGEDGKEIQLTPQLAADFMGYHFIRAAVNDLRNLVREPSPKIRATSYLVRDEKGRARWDGVGFFAESIEGEPLDYIRECPKCKRIFFAARKNQPGCNPATCNIALRKKRERDNAEYKKTKKAKRGNRK